MSIAGSNWDELVRYEIVDVDRTCAFILEKLHRIELGLELLRFILPALPVTLSARSFVFAGLDLRNSHYIEKRDVHNP